MHDPAFDLTFDRLLCPVRTDDFLAEHWDRSPLFVQRHDPGYYRDLLSTADVDACLTLALNRSAADILHVIPPFGSGRPATLTPAAAVTKDRLYSAYLSGDTIRLIGIEKLWPPLDPLMASMHETLDAPAGANLFLTPPRSQAFSLHFDTLDGFILQLAGSKHWQVWEPTYERPLDFLLSKQHVMSLVETDESKLKLRESVVLEAGDMLYLPRGFYHKAIALSEPSLHLTVSVHPLTWLDLFKRSLELAALETPELRLALPPGFAGDQEVQQRMSLTFARRLSQLTERLDLDAALRSVVQQEAAARTFPSDGHFAMLAELPELNADALVERRRGLVCVVESTGTTATIKFGPNRVRGPIVILPALEFIRDHRRFSVGDLPGSVSLQGRVTLVLRLIREGLLRPAS